MIFSLVLTKTKLTRSPGRQVPVDVVLTLEVSHPSRHLGAHVNQLLELHRPALALELLQQAAVLHELGDDEDWFLVGADGVQLDQLGMAELLHDLSLAQEVLRVHRA